MHKAVRELKQLISIHTLPTALWIVAAILSVVQVSKIHFNPWSRIVKWIGDALNESVIEIIDENKAENCRCRMLWFDGEIRVRKLHTEEHFHQILGDIREYEEYCSVPPNDQNRKAESAIQKILEVYRHCKNTNNILN